MSASKDFLEYVTGEVLAGISGISHRSMFGGYGLYKDGTIFGIITSDDALYFKVGDSNRRDYEELGSKPFEYTKKDGKTSVMSYWGLPAEIMEDRDEIEKWVDKACQAKRD